MSARTIPLTRPRAEPARPLASEFVSARRHGLVVPVVSVASSIAMLLVAVACNAARAQDAFAAAAFWAGLIVLFVPIAACLTHPLPDRNERLWAVMCLGVGAYAVKLMYSPNLFTFPDELQHWRTLVDIARTGHLFEFNPILRVSALYPGLEIVTQALVASAGLPMFWAALLVIGVARLVLVLALFLFFESASGSAYVAGAAVLVYVGNPNFVYFGGQYGYESLALPLAALVLFTVVRQRSARDRGTAVSLGFAALLGIGAIVVTHHFTQFVLPAVLGAWAVCALLNGLLRRSRETLTESARVGALAICGAAAAGAWLVSVAPDVVEYLGPNFSVGFAELVAMLSGQGSGRVPFQDGAGRQAPAAEQLVGYASVLLVLLALPVGLRILWRDHRRDGAAWALTALAIAYPLTLPLRLTPGGIATAGRLPEFLYLGLALTTALVLVRFRSSGPAGHVVHVTATACAVIVLIGGVFVGWGPPGRLPHGYLVSADARSVEPQGVSSAEWALRVLGFGRGMAADRTNGLLMGAFGLQGIVSVSNAREDVSPVFFAPGFGPHERYILEATGVRFAVVDWRLAQSLPVSGVYYEFQEPGGFRHTRPIDLEALAKFDRTAGVSRIYDSGDIAIYDVGLLSRAP